MSRAPDEAPSLSPATAGRPATAAPPAPGELTHEDIDRAADRLAVVRARTARRFRPVWLLWLFVGPGVLVFLGENDAPSMLSYAATGARFGIGFFLPFVALTFLMAYVVQEMTVRLGAVTHRGHAELIFDRFGTFWGAFAMIDLVIGNFLTLVTEFVGVRAGLGFFGVPPAAAVGLGLALVLAAMATGRYWTWERIALGLAAFNLLFIPAALLAHPAWRSVGHSLLFWSPLPRGQSMEILLLIMADIGATVTPWMIFFQQSALVDKGAQPRDITAARAETMLGTGLAALCAIAAIIATTPLFRHGINAADFQAAQFAGALRPWIGSVGATLFALGLFEAGLLAAITISTSSAYAFGEVLRVGHSLNWPLQNARPFYIVLMGSAALAAGVVLLPHVPLESIALIVNVLATLEMPPALLFLLLLVNDREVMGDQANGSWSNAAAIAVVVLLVVAGLTYGTMILRSP
ncbi:MAG TPA: divalent metal cation transporter [Candidatus Acidoferrales bacterium]|nr:divalent metal cation transporter [Candidatus Acidoferrales bacterium]